VSRTQERLADALQAAAGAVREDTLRPLGAARSRRRLPVLAPVAAAVSVLLIIGLALAVSPLAHRRSLAPAGGVAPVVPVGGFPTGIALDTAHNTIYVSAGTADELSMINTADCNAAYLAGCSHTGRVATAGQDPIGVAVDDQTHTVYAVNGGSNTVAVINSATCNATDNGGCAAKPALVNVPGGPEFLAIDPQTNTIYVADTGSGTVSVIDGNTCNASDTSGCTTAPATVNVGAGAFPIAVDPGTNTVYVGVNTGVAVIDGQTCNASDTSGCASKPAMIAVGNQPAGISVDQATGTVYVSGESGSVAVIARDTCDSADTAGCGNTPVTVPVGSDPRGDAVDPASGTVYVTNAASGTVSMISTATCSAADQSGCRSPQAAFPVGTSPRRIAVDTATHTVYIVNVGASTLSVINSLSCNASDTSGCPTKSPAGTGAALGGRGAAAGMVSTCAPAVTSAASGQPAGALTGSSREVASGSVGGQPWSLWAKQGVTGVNAIEDGGLVLGGRWYGLCAGFPNLGEMELIDTGGRGIDYGFVAFPGTIGVKLTSGGALPDPQVRQVAAGVSFFIGELPQSACAYSSMVLSATGTSGSSMHHLGFGACQADHVVEITQSNGTWSGGQIGASAAGLGSGLSGGGNLANIQDDCSQQATSADSGQPAVPLTSSEVKVASGLVGGQPWSLWAKRGDAGVAGVENGGLVLGGRWYGLCPGFPNPAEFEVIDAGSQGIVYGYVANPGHYAIKLTSSGTSPAPPAPAEQQVQGGTFFIGVLPKSACSYSTMVLNATTASASDAHQLGFGTCKANELVPIQTSEGVW
jgi:DNA-binding beta-propeller fold protein YncE